MKKEHTMLEGNPNRSLFCCSLKHTCKFIEKWIWLQSNLIRRYHHHNKSAQGKNEKLEKKTSKYTVCNWDYSATSIWTQFNQLRLYSDFFFKINIYIKKGEKKKKRKQVAVFKLCVFHWFGQQAKLKMFYDPFLLCEKKYPYFT